MRKLILTFMIAMVMAMSSVCMAANDGTDLNRQQKVVDRFMEVLGAADNSGYVQLKNDFVPDLQQQITADKFEEMRQQMSTNFGKVQEVRFVAYERFDQGDRLTYLANYSRQQIVRLVYNFDKAGKITEFLFVPLEVKQQQ